MADIIQRLRAKAEELEDDNYGEECHILRTLATAHEAGKFKTAEDVLAFLADMNFFE